MMLPLPESRSSSGRLNSARCLREDLTAMTSAFPCEVYDHWEPASGTWNMALDEALLERAISEGVGHFRLYRWSAPTISLGYFQEYIPDTLPAELRGLEVVKRLSGGGAILHHHEVTYSCSLPPGNTYEKNPSRLYVDMHTILLEGLARQGFECRFRGISASVSRAEPFLCYSRGDERDLVHHSDKIVGSAQRRRRGAILQHGSLLLRRSEFAREFPGVADLMQEGQLISEPSLCEDIISGVTDLFPFARLKVCYPERISVRAAELSESRYQFMDKRFRKP